MSALFPSIPETQWVCEIKRGGPIYQLNPGQKLRKLNRTPLDEGDGKTPCQRDSTCPILVGEEVESNNLEIWPLSSRGGLANVRSE